MIHKKTISYVITQNGELDDEIKNKLINDYHRLIIISPVINFYFNLRHESNYIDRLYTDIEDELLIHEKRLLSMVDEVIVISDDVKSVIENRPNGLSVLKYAVAHGKPIKTIKDF
jgi:hypothetical protein